jgi:hypothetical protein
MDCIGCRAWQSDHVPLETAEGNHSLSLDEAQLMLKFITESSSFQIPNNTARCPALWQCVDLDTQEQHDAGIVSVVDAIGKAAAGWLDSRFAGVQRQPRDAFALLNKIPHHKLIK